jgi:tetratricopeptide (TPR) repeat protein
MKNSFFCLPLVMVLLSCASSAARDSVSLDTAIQTSVEEIDVVLNAGRHVAVMKFDSYSPELSAYIMEELTGRLVKGGKYVMVDRKNIECVQRDIQLQKAGELNIEQACSIGRMMGAQSIVTGSLAVSGKAMVWHVTVLGTEKGTVETAISMDIHGGREFSAQVTAIKNGSLSADTSYRETELARTPKSPSEYMNKGLMFALRRNYRATIDNFDEALKLDSRMALVYLERGKICLVRQADISGIMPDFDLNWVVSARDSKEGDAQALADFTRAMEIDPNLAAAYFYRGGLFCLMGDYDKALADCNQLITIRPNEAMPYYHRGLVYHNSGNNDNAIADFDQAIRLSPNFALAYGNRGNAYYDKGSIDKAIADYSEAIRIRPNEASAYYNRGVAHMNNDKLDAAIADYTEAVTIDPDYAAAYNNRGTVYGKTRNYDRAIADFTEEIRITPNADSAFFNRGVAYMNKSDYKNAIADFEQAIKLNLNNVQAKTALEQARRHR